MPTPVFGLILPTDINECEQFGVCPQKCQNTKGSYECFCADGFKSMSVRYGERCAADGRIHSHLDHLACGERNAEENVIPGNKFLLLVSYL